MINDVFKNVDKLFDEYMSLFKDIVCLETYSTDKADIDRLVNFLADFSHKKGYQTTVHNFPISGNGLLVTSNNGSKLPPIALCGHMDTVHPKGSFETVFKIEDNKVYGPGVFDMKGGLIIGLLAMEALKKANYKSRSIKFIFVPDEERSEGLSGTDGKAFIVNNAKGCAAAFTLEGTESDDKITVGRKGSIRYKVKVHGVAAHAGACYAQGRSAIKEASHKIIDIEASSVPNQITYNCGMINGGTSPNTVPEFCEFMLYNRYWTNEQYKELRNHVESILNHQYIAETETSFQVIGERRPMEASEANKALADHIINISNKYNFGQMHQEKKNSGSDACYTAQAGTPSVCSMGPIGANAHMLNEFCYVDSIKDRAKLLAASILELPDNF